MPRSSLRSLVKPLRCPAQRADARHTEVQIFELGHFPNVFEPPAPLTAALQRFSLPLQSRQTLESLQPGVAYPGSVVKVRYVRAEV